MVETGGQFSRGDRAEYPENVHEVDVVDQVIREVEWFFHEVEPEVIVQAHEYPQHERPDQVEREQFGGREQVQVRDDKRFEILLLRFEVHGTGTEYQEQDREDGTQYPDRGGCCPPRKFGTEVRGDHTPAHSPEGVPGDVQSRDFALVFGQHFFRDVRQRHGRRPRQQESFQGTQCHEQEKGIGVGADHRCHGGRQQRRADQFLPRYAVRHEHGGKQPDHHAQRRERDRQTTVTCRQVELCREVGEQRLKIIQLREARESRQEDAYRNRFVFRTFR